MFEAAVKAHFRKLTPLLDVELARVAKAPFSEDTRFLLVEYDSAHFGEDFSVSAWPMNKAGDPTAERRRLLEGKAVTVPPEIYDDPKYEELGHWDLASQLLERWFVTRWKHLHKKLKPRPAVIGHHDSYFKTDLQTGERVNWDNVLKAARANPTTPMARRR